MKETLTLLFLIFLVCTTNAQQPEPANLHNLDPYNPEFVPGEVLVKFKDDAVVMVQNLKNNPTTGLASIDVFIARRGVISCEKVFTGEEKRTSIQVITTPDGQTKILPQLFNIYRFKSGPNADVKSMVDELKSNPFVEFAEPDYYFYSMEGPEIFKVQEQGAKVFSFGTPSPSPAGSSVVTVAPDDPMYPLQWYLQALNAPAAWDTTTGDTTQIIGIIDTGVDWTHPDLSVNIWTNWDEIPDNGIDDDGNGKIDDRRGWDFVNNDNNPMDDNSHGTHVAGIAAAKGNNTIGITGIAWNSKIIPIKVMQSSGYGSSSDIANGVNYARVNGATILNLSLGSYGESLTLKTALENAYSNAVIVAAAGNNGYKVDPPYPPAPIYAPLYPACYPWVIGVQATSQDGALAEFSNFDPSGPVDALNLFGHNYELKAPGVNILSTFPNGSYNNLSGTSMASPVVAGAVALIKSQHPFLSNEELFARLIQSSNGGILNISSAMNYLLVPDIHFVSSMIVDTLDGCDRDGKADAGESFLLWFKVKNAGGFADSVYARLRFSPYEDTTVATIIDSTSYIGDISAYGSMTGQSDPFKTYIKPWVANNRDVRFQYEIGTKNSPQKIVGNISLTVSNGEELGGIYYGMKHLTPDRLYLVTSNAVFDTLKIDPGTRIQISDGKSIFISSKMICNGKPDSMIVFTQNGTGYWLQIKNVSNVQQSMSFCVFEYFGGNGLFIAHVDGFSVNSSIFRNGRQYFSKVITSSNIQSCLFNNNFVNFAGDFGSADTFKYNVVTGNRSNYWTKATFLSGIAPNQIKHNSIFNNIDYNYSGPQVWGMYKLSPNYWGTIDSLTIEQSINDFFENSSYAVVDGFDSAQIAPSALCHGHVWKIRIDSIEINKFDNPYNSLNGLGIVSLGIHRFDVYFNRAMDLAVTPFITFGLREPYTQHVLDDSTFWSSDSTIWTAFYNIGIETGDGIQRVRVDGARDNEHFDIPVEDSRFEFVIQAAGSASIEFSATPGIGKVSLEWNRAGTEDALGYNMYRYFNITDSTFSAPIRINPALITDTLFTDFEVIPDTTYHYYYKIVGTDLVESDSSQIIAATPYTAATGDANGDESVNVLDIMAVISYMLGQDPQPFLFDAADINDDNAINILDVIGIVNRIIHPEKSGFDITGTNPVAAHIRLENDRIILQSDGQIASMQFELTGEGLDKIRLAEPPAGFELAYGIVKGKLLGILYSSSRKAIPAGTIDLVKIVGKSAVPEWGTILAGDGNGNIVPVLKETPAGNAKPEMFLQAYPNPFSQKGTFSFRLTSDAHVKISVYNMAGKLVTVLADKEMKEGMNYIDWNGTNFNRRVVPSGIYLCRLEGTVRDGSAFHRETRIVFIN